MERSDDDLLKLAVQGDVTCFGELVERWQNPIFRFIYRYVGSCEDAQDLTQDTFAKAYRNLGRLSDPRRFSSWLYTIALNECRMKFRRRTPIDVPIDDYVGSSAEKATQENPEGQLVTRERSRLLREAFDDLPEEQRAVILMKEYQGLKFIEIAEVMDVPVSTVKSRMYLGLKTLRRLMERRL